MVVTRWAKTAFAVSTDIAGAGCVSRDMYVFDLNEKADNSSSPNATLKRGFGETRDEIFLKKAVAHSVPAE